MSDMVFFYTLAGVYLNSSPAEISPLKRIIEAARRVLIRNGSNGFSLRMVATEASLSLSNVQYHFGTRAAVLDGILSGFIEEYQNDLGAYLHTGGDGQNALTNFIREILLDESKKDEIRFFRSLLAFANEDVIAEHLTDFYLEIYSLIQNVLARLSGKEPDSPKVHWAASLLLPFLNGYGTVCGCLGLALDETAQELSSWVWELIRPE